MIANINNLTPLKNIFQNSERFSWKVYLFSTLTFILLFGAAHFMGLALFLLLGVVGVCLIWIVLHYPQMWIYGVVIVFALFFDQTDDDISAYDIVAAVFFNLFLIVWFVSKLLGRIERQKYNTIGTSLQYKNIATNAQKYSFFNFIKLSEKLFILFYFLLLTNSAIAYFNDVPITVWIRDYMLFTLMLYCFPIIEYINTPRRLTIFMAIFAIVTIFLEIRQFYYCYLVFQKINYAWQVGGTIRVNQGMYSAATISGVTLFLFAERKRNKLFAFIITAMSTGAIITTFSRGYWMAIIICIALLLVFLHYKQILQLFCVAILSIGLMIVALNTFLPVQATFVQKFVSKRFTSTTKGKADISVRSRLEENQVVIAKIKEAPISGFGLRSKYSKYFSISQTTVTDSFIHNGYLNLTHKAGVFICALFYLALILFTIRGALVAWRLKKLDSLYRKSLLSTRQSVWNIRFLTAITISVTLTLIMFFITNFITSSFFMRDGFILTAIAIAFINIAERQLAEITDGASTWSIDTRNAV